MADANDPYAVTADELRQFIERFEQLEAEIIAHHTQKLGLEKWRHRHG